MTSRRGPGQSFRVRKEIACVPFLHWLTKPSNSKAVNWLRENYEKTLNVDDLASMTGMSRSTSTITSAASQL